MDAYKPSRSLWLNPDIQYLFNSEIIEYDIQDAGFSLVRQYRLLPQQEIVRLSQCQKGLERHIAIGKLQKGNKQFATRLSEKFTEIRALFIGYNKLTDDRIISVKKDAIYTIGKCEKINFGEIHFLEKNHYTSYVRFPHLSNLELYYDSVTNNIDVKGMSDVSVNRHRLYMLDFLRTVINACETKDMSVKRFVSDFIMKYKTLALDERYYLEFNNMSNTQNVAFNYQNIIVPMVQILLREVVL